MGLLSPSTPPNVTSTGTSSTTLPSGYMDYANNAWGLGSQIATTPWQGYQGQLTAGPTSLQQNAASMAPGATGSYQPYFGAATGALSSVAPMVGQQSGLANTAGAMGLNATYNPSNQWPSQSSNWMNPYTSNVVNQIAQAGNQNFETQLMPAINSQFIGSGDFGSLNNMNGLGLGAGLAQQGITSAQAQALQSGYGQGMQGFLTQQGNQIGAANNAANAANQTGYMANYGNLGLGSQLGNLGSQASQLGWNDVNNTMGLGSQFQNIGQNAINAQLGQWNQYLGWPTSQLQGATQGIQGLPTPGTVSGTSNAPLAGAQYGPSTLAQMGTGLNFASTLGQALPGITGGLNSAYNSLFGSNTPTPTIPNPSTGTVDTSYLNNSLNGGLSQYTGGFDMFGNPIA